MAQQDKDGVSRVEFNDLKADVKDLKKVYDLINRQTVATEKLAIEMKFMREKQNNIEGRVTVLEAVPTKRYDTIITQIVGNIIALVLGAVAVIIGLKK